MMHESEYWMALGWACVEWYGNDIGDNTVVYYFVFTYIIFISFISIYHIWGDVIHNLLGKQYFHYRLVAYKSMA